MDAYIGFVNSVRGAVAIDGYVLIISSPTLEFSTGMLFRSRSRPDPVSFFRSRPVPASVVPVPASRLL